MSWVRVRANVNLTGGFVPGEMYDVEATEEVETLIRAGYFTRIQYATVEPPEAPEAPAPAAPAPAAPAPAAPPASPAPPPAKEA